MNAEPNKKSRRSLLMVIGVFALPIVLAKLALMLGWLDYGVTNRGQLVENELTLVDIGVEHPDLDQMWLIMYALPNECTEQCEQTLLSVNNTFVALGREMPKVKNVALYQQRLTNKQLEKIDLSNWSMLPTPNEPHLIIQQPTVLLVDPLGNIILEHSLPETSEQLAVFGKGILADMKKLLKYSKIG
jgi:hypothetical protein